MSLLELEEPKELKQMIKELNTVLGGKTRGKSKGLLVYNKLPQYIWSFWNRELRKLGIDWREFLSIVSKNSDLIFEWAVEEKISWREFLSKLRDALTTYSRTKTEKRVSLDSYIKKSI
ncbi:MAG: hypothetical protein QXM79_01275 [Zestosphaera sp.]